MQDDDITLFQRALARQRREGVVSTAALDDAGIGRKQREGLLASGELRRIHRGWYHFRAHDPKIATAIRLGGRLTCVSTIERMDVWMPVRSGTHVRVAPGAALPRAGHVTAHRLDDSPLGRDSVDDLDVSLHCAFRCLDPLDALIVADSIVNKRLRTLDELHLLANAAPRRVRRLILHADGRSQSGTETIVRNALRGRNVPFTAQAEIEGVGRVDLLVGDRLIIECDSAAFHTRDEHHAEDRRRDLIAVALGYMTVRLTFQQVRHDWQQTWTVLEHLLRAGCHKWSSRDRRLATSVPDLARGRGPSIDRSPRGPVDSPPGAGRLAVRCRPARPATRDVASRTIESNGMPGRGH
ncbi:hypothetical protein GCM10011490_21360 [Pseudoclavibacter endophyticus]|uniref:DUF559 domain-containing protein n=1 Tax=Pseudoclavibacter endophyticus TaxID=1778590 RepID=A0A6H9WQ90_9MICO|nr:hypothetical protein [Pseudoclavibacter endophyticus]KAB1648185.1 hypothetical protein F8O04_10740 [Pseudoclavibacter endophyticus]GGA70473.1 hypothetical protein GCM10011490_21360 [Pseudoclavibacter endophyticus]